MKLKYSLNQKDYVKHLQYDASKSKSFKYQKLLGWLFFAFILGLGITIIYLLENKPLLYSAIFVSIIGLILFPKHQTNHSEDHFNKVVKKSYSNRFGKELIIEFKDQFIETYDVTGESKINYTSLEKIVEIPTHFFIFIRTGGTFIIPKKKDDAEKIREYLKMLSKQIEIEYFTELEWEWK